MAKSRPSVQKRKMEAKKMERTQAKAAKKAERAENDGDAIDVPEGVDPDLVGIVAGPQPSIYGEEEEEFDISSIFP